MGLANRLLSIAQLLTWSYGASSEDGAVFSSKVIWGPWATLQWRILANNYNYMEFMFAWKAYSFLALFHQGCLTDYIGIYNFEINACNKLHEP